MTLLALIGWALLGSVVAIGIAEVAAAKAAIDGWSPFIVGPLCAGSQLSIHVLLFVFGERVMAKWSWLARQAERTRERFEERLDQGYLGLTLIGGMVGTPPIIAMVLLAPSFKMPMVRTLALAFGGRTVRFTVIALLGQQALDWFS